MSRDPRCNCGASLKGTADQARHSADCPVYNGPTSPSRARPSDRAIAQAFWVRTNLEEYFADSPWDVMAQNIIDAAKRLDTTPEARAGDWIAEVLAEMESWAQEMARTDNPGHHRLDKIARRIRAGAKLDPRPRLTTKATP